MATLLDQLDAVTDTTSLKNWIKTHLFNADGTLRYEIIPLLRAEDGPAMTDLVLSLTAGGGTTNPVPTPLPPVAMELLADAMRSGFTLKNRDTQDQVVELVKNQAYTVSITVKSTNGGGVYFQFVRPHGDGFGYRKLAVGVNTFEVIPTDPTGGYRFSVAANSSTSVVTTCSLTKKLA